MKKFYQLVKSQNKFPRKLSNNWTHRDTLKLVIVVEEVCILLTSYIFRKSCPHVSNFYYCYWQFKWKSILRDNRVQLRHVRILRQQTIAPKQNNTKSVECPSKLQNMTKWQFRPCKTRKENDIDSKNNPVVGTIVNW